MAALKAVIPAKAGTPLTSGVRRVQQKLGPRFRGGDGDGGVVSRGEDIYLNRLGFTGSALSGSSGQACLGYLPRMSERTEG